MAAELGTRMRSKLPKHLHPLLGRRVVDWVLEAARPLGPQPFVVVASPDTRDAFEDLDIAVRSGRSAPGTRSAPRRRRFPRTSMTCSCCRATPRC